MRTRTQTLLFTDVVASTELRSRLGEREAEAQRLDHFRRLREQIARHRGREVKTLGDGVMVTFDAARDGLECAVAMQQAAARGRDPVLIRIGLSSGDVGLEDGDCFGIAVIEASRLCAQATGGQVLVAEAARILARDYGPLREIGPVALKGLADATLAWEALWSSDAPARVRAVLADDSVLVREGVAHALESAGIEVLGQAADGEQALALTAEFLPDLAVIDLRMPPTFTTEGLQVAELIRARYPGTGVLVLTQELEPHYARRLLAAGGSGVGYMLKESVTDLREFADAARRVAAGGIAFEPSILSISGEGQ